MPNRPGWVTSTPTLTLMPTEIAQTAETQGEQLTVALSAVLSAPLE